MDILNHFQDFLNKSLLIDQTQLVSEVIRKGSKLEYHNKEIFRATLSNGIITGTESLIIDMCNELQCDLAEINEKLFRAGDEMLIKELKVKKDTLVGDLNALKGAESSEKKVLQWLLVPYWLSEELIQYGEVILRHMGCSFWGIGYRMGKPLPKEDVLIDIFEGMNH